MKIQWRADFENQFEKKRIDGKWVKVYKGTNNIVPEKEYRQLYKQAQANQAQIQRKDFTDKVIDPFIYSDDQKEGGGLKTLTEASSDRNREVSLASGGEVTDTSQMYDFNIGDPKKIDPMGTLLNAAKAVMDTTGQPDYNYKFAQEVLYSADNKKIANDEIGQDPTWFQFSVDPNNATKAQNPVSSVSPVVNNIVDNSITSEDSKLQTEAEARDAWLKKTRNSPAQQSGAWAGEEHKLWEQSLKGGANKGRVFADSIKDDKLIESPLLKASNR